jgi:hypothetical protein
MKSQLPVCPASFSCLAQRLQKRRARCESLPCCEYSSSTNMGTNNCFANRDTLTYARVRTQRAHVRKKTWLETSCPLHVADGYCVRQGRLRHVKKCMSTKRIARLGATQAVRAGVVTDVTYRRANAARRHSRTLKLLDLVRLETDHPRRGVRRRPSTGRDRC